MRERYETALPRLKQSSSDKTRLRDAGLTVIIAEQDLRRTLRIADFAYVLENGAVVSSGRGDDLAYDPDVRRAYLGLTEGVKGH